MKVFNTHILYHWLPVLSLILISQSIFAADYSGYISEEYLRSQFTFKAGDSLSLANSQFKRPSVAEIIRDSAFPSGTC